MRLRSPGKVSEWLLIAADFPRTFYGLLAQRALGMDIAGPKPRQRLDRAQSQRLLADPAARRAVALLQTGERARAESELARLDGDGDEALAAALSALNDAAGFPAHAMRVPRGKSGGRQKVALPEGYLDDLSDATPPGAEAESTISGG